MNHTTHTIHSDYSLSGIDLFLALMGLVGVVLFGLFLPAEHPDSSAVFEISESEAVNLASEFLESQGLILDGLEIDASLRRNTELLLDLQEAIGRPVAVEFLESENRNQVAAFFWKVDFDIPRDPDSGKIIEDLKQIYQVELAQNGKIIRFIDSSLSLAAQGRRFGSTLEKVNRAALSTILKPDSSDGAETHKILVGLADSVFVKSLRINVDLARRSPSDSMLMDLLASRPVVLDSAQVHQLVNFHLAKTAYVGLDWKLTSILVQNNSGIPFALAQLVSAQPIAGQNITLVAKIPASGSLAGLEISYASEIASKSNVSQVVNIIGGGLLVLFAFVFVVAFFRRMISRLLDMKSAMIDAMMLGLATGVVAVLFSSSVADFIKTVPLWGGILIYLLVFSFAAGGVAVFAFMVAGVTDSVVREHDSGKLRTLTLLRHGDVVNRPLGASFVRGGSIAGILLGMSAFSLSLLPQLSLDLNELLLGDSSIRPFVGVLFSTLSSSYFYVLLWLVGVSAVSLKWSRKPFLTVLLVVLTGSVLNITPFSMVTGNLSLIVAGFFALVLALAYIRFDILTVLVALFLSKMIWQLSEGYLIAGSTSWIDLMLAILFVASVLILGVMGVLSSRTGQDADSYVPGYVTEMAGQERVKRELEIAQQVQTFFLPRKMPSIAGLDISGMCLPATEVGGDYFDFIELDGGRMAFILGDVSGKGIEAAFFMTLVKGITQTLSRQGLAAAEVMRNLNHLFCMNAPAGTFISVIYGEFDPQDNSFTFSRAGHNPAILYESASSTAKALQPKGMAIGFVDGERFDTTIEQMKVLLNEGDSMVFYTDGFSEAMNRKRDLYGDDRLLQKVSQYGNRSASAILRLLTEDVHHFIEGMGRADDMTMVVFKLQKADESNV
jgi:phosphoserine phosphatase RsbU/P